MDGDVNAVPKQAISMGIQNIMEAKKDFTTTAHAVYFTPNSIDS